MSTAPLKVVCNSCSTKFHVADHLIRGKVVKFRCRKCQAPIDVDGTDLPEALAPQAVVATEADVVTAEAPVAVRVSEAPMRLSMSDGLEGLSSPELARVEFGRVEPLAPPPVFAQYVDLASIRRPSDPFGIRASNYDPMLAPPPVSTTATRSAASVAYSDAPTEIEVHSRPVPAGRSETNRWGRALASAAVLAAACATTWSLAVRHPFTNTGSAATADDRGAMTARMQPSDFQGVSAEPPPPGVKAEAPLVPAKLTPPIEPKAPEMVAAKAEPAEAPSSPPADVKSLPVEKPAPHVVLPTAPASQAMAPIAPAAAPAPQVAAPSTIPPTETSPAGATPPSATAAVAVDSDFNTQAARTALEEAGQKAWDCRSIDAPAGAARVAVTFAPTGRVTSAVIEAGAFAGTAAGGCVVSKFRSVHVPPFAGDNVTVHKTVSF